MIRNIPFNIRNNAEKGRESIERMMDYLMEQPLNPIGKVSGALASFRVDIVDAEDRYEIQAELPGFSKEEISLSYEADKYLTIAAECPETVGGLKYVCRERRNGKFERTFMVDGIDWDNVSAGFDNGILKVSLPKVKDESVKKFIHIG